MRNIAIIPARSGSKGLKDKNIKLLNGKPLMAYSIEAACRSNIYACVHVSTDSCEYAQIAQRHGGEVPFLRNRELSSDTASTWDTVKFVLSEYKKLGHEFDMVTILQPTSPMRDEKDILDAYRLFQAKEADAVISVCEMEHSPLICNMLPENNVMTDFIDVDKIGRRQDMPVYYRVNGAMYMLGINSLLNIHKIYGDRSFAYIMEKYKSIDIDDEYDFKFAEMVMAEKRESVI